MTEQQAGRYHGEQMTVDQLAEAADLTVRTVRFYATRGLLPPPQLRGRTGIYTAQHLARLRLVKSLQQLGMTLQAVEQQLQAIPDDAGAEDIRMRQELLQPWLPEEPEELDTAQLEQRAGFALDAEQLGVLQTLDALRPTAAGTSWIAPSAVTLDVALEGLRIGLSPEVLTEASKIVEAHTGALAADLQRLFAEQVLQPIRHHGTSDAHRHRIRESMPPLRSLTTRLVVAGFHRAVNRVLRATLTEPGTGEPADRAREVHSRTPGSASGVAVRE